MRVSLGANFLSSFYFPKRRIYGNPYFSGVFALNQIKKAPGRLLSTSAKPQTSLAQNNPYAKLVFWGAAYSDPLKNHEER